MAGWNKGVREGKLKLVAPETILAERNLLGVPIYVMNKNLAMKSIGFCHRWRSQTGADASFELLRTGNYPLPTISHARILDLMIGMFANNFNDEGILRFRYEDILRLFNRSRSRGGAIAIKEAILRYMTAACRRSERLDGRELSWSGFIIIASSMSMTNDESKSPRNSKNPEDWNWIVFNPEIVKSIKSNDTRRLLAEIVCGDLKNEAYALYRYLCGFRDDKRLKRSYSQLATAINFADRRTNRFEVWLEKQLQVLKAKGYVSEYALYDDWCQITLVPLKSLIAEKNVRDTLLEVERLVGVPIGGSMNGPSFLPSDDVTYKG